MTRGATNDLAQLARTARAQLNRAQVLGKSLDVLAARARQDDPLWQPDEMWRDTFREVTSTISQCGAALTKALEANEKSLARATDKQLELQLKQELLKMAETFSPDEWQIIDNARARQARYKERGAGNPDGANQHSRGRPKAGG